MKITWRIGLISGLLLILAGAMGCDGGGRAVLGDDPNTDPFALGGSGAIKEGLTLMAANETIDLDPCDADAPTDPDTGKLLGQTEIGAYLLDADLMPVVGAEVTFGTSAGELESMGQPVLTDENGLATDTLAVDEDDAGDVVVTATSGELMEMITILVKRLERPELTLEMQPAYLWPPNHKLHRVRAVFGGLDCEPAPNLELLSVTSNEPDNDIGDGDTTDDIQGADIGSDDSQFMLRAERAGGGDGRVYTVTYSATDAEGGRSMLEATVVVPHDQDN